MSDLAPTLTEIQNLLRAWLDTQDGTETDSAPLGTNVQLGGLVGDMTSLAGDVGEVLTDLANIINSQVTNFGTMITNGAALLTGTNTLVTRTAPTGALSTSIADLLTAITAMQTDVDTVQTSVGAVDTVLDGLPLDVQTRMNTLLDALQTSMVGEINNAIDGVSSHDDANREEIIDSVSDSIATVSQQVLDRTEWVRMLTFEYVQTARLLTFDQLAQDREYLKAEILAKQLGVLSHLDFVRGALLSDIQGILDASRDATGDAIVTAVGDVNAHTDEVRGSIASDTGAALGMAVNDLVTHANNIEQAENVRLDHIDQTISDLQTDSTYTKTNVDNLPGVIALWAQDQGDRLYNYMANGLSPEIVSARDYVVQQGENQRDYVVQELRNTVNETDDKVEENRIVLNDIQNKVNTIADAAGAPLSFNNVGETTFDGITDWGVAGDFYEVEFDAWPPGRAVMPLGDESYVPHMGWCAFKQYGGFERGPLLEFTKNLIQGGKLRPQGLLVYCKPGTTGVIRAYQYQ